MHTSLLAKIFSLRTVFLKPLPFIFKHIDFPQWYSFLKTRYVFRLIVPCSLGGNNEDIMKKAWLRGTPVLLLAMEMQGANLSVRSGVIALGNQLTAPDKHKNLCGLALKTMLVYSVNEI
jgi:hypothetical protein